MNTLSRSAKWLLLAAMVAATVAGLVLLRHAQSDTPALQTYALRTGVVIAALGAWFLSQSLIGTRAQSDNAMRDGIHEMTERWHRYLQANPRQVDRLLIASSFFIDVFGVFLIGISIFGPSIRPFVALLILFLLRQVCQGLCALPPPPGMLWRNPGAPSLLVTYDVANDFFFSGHTSIAILGAVEVARIAPWWLGLAAVVVAVLEMTTVLVLRAHYTMDVFAAAVAAFFAIQASGWICSML